MVGIAKLFIEIDGLTTMKMKPKSLGRINTKDLTPEEIEDIKYMRAAYAQAKKAYMLGEVPIGCVIVYEGKIIGRGYNRRNTDKRNKSK